MTSFTNELVPVTLAPYLHCNQSHKAPLE